MMSLNRHLTQYIPLRALLKEDTHLTKFTRFRTDKIATFYLKQL